MIDKQETEVLKDIVRKYREAEKKLVEVEKMQEALKARVKQVTEEISVIQATESEFLRGLNEKYSKVFTANELYEIANK
jgi:septal ring factor EnvC (AmiA/AmiB activator)